MHQGWTFLYKFIRLSELSTVYFRFANKIQKELKNATKCNKTGGGTEYQNRTAILAPKASVLPLHYILYII